MNFEALGTDLQHLVLVYVDEWTLMSFRETNKKFWSIIEREDNLYRLKCNELFKQDSKTKETWRDTFHTMSCKISTYVTTGNLPNIEFLFDKGALDVHYLHGGLTYLMTAAIYNEMDVAKFFLDKGTDINVSSLPDGMTALLFAVKWGNLNMVKYLVEQGADLEAETTSGKKIFDFMSSWYTEIKEYIHDELEQRQPMFGDGWHEMMDDMSKEMVEICAEVECLS